MNVNYYKQFYDLLGLAEGATREDIDKAFRVKSVAVHPDTALDKSDPIKNKENYFKLQEARRELLKLHTPKKGPSVDLNLEKLESLNQKLDAALQQIGSQHSRLIGSAEDEKNLQALADLNEAGLELGDSSISNNLQAITNEYVRVQAAQDLNQIKALLQTAKNNLTNLRGGNKAAPEATAAAEVKSAPPSPAPVKPTTPVSPPARPAMPVSPQARSAVPPRPSSEEDLSRKIANSIWDAIPKKFKGKSGYERITESRNDHCINVFGTRDLVVALVSVLNSLEGAGGAYLMNQHLAKEKSALVPYEIKLNDLKKIQDALFTSHVSMPEKLSNQILVQQQNNPAKNTTTANIFQKLNVATQMRESITPIYTTDSSSNVKQSPEKTPTPNASNAALERKEPAEKAASELNTRFRPR